MIFSAMASNVAARLEGIAEPGGICISSSAYDQVRGKVPVEFTDLGEQTLKNIARPIRVYALVKNALDVRRQAENGGPSSPFAPRLSSPSPSKDLSSSEFALKGDPPPLPDKPSIAVLPFQNMSGDPEQEYFADGIVEDIITALSRFKSLFVIARNSSFIYKGKAVDLRQVGHELGVRYVLEGSVRKTGNRIRVTAQLIEAASGTHLWADKFDAALEDVFELQDNVTFSVAGMIAPTVLETEARALNRKQHLDVYDRYLRVMVLLNEFTPTPLREAYREARKIIEADPRFGPAYAQAAWSLYRLKMVCEQQLTDQELEEAIRLAASAVELASDDETAIARAAQILAHFNKEFERGLALANRAIALNPNSNYAWMASGWANFFMGQFSDASQASAKALRLNPLHPASSFGPLRGLAATAAMERRYDDVIAWTDKLLAIRPNDLMSLMVLCEAKAQTKKLDEAALIANRVRNVYPQMRNSQLMQMFGTFRRPEDLARVREMIRPLGLPE
jgi:adenylate cyclase